MPISLLSPLHFFSPKLKKGIKIFSKVSLQNDSEIVFFSPQEYPAPPVMPLIYQTCNSITF